MRELYKTTMKDHVIDIPEADGLIDDKDDNPYGLEEAPVSGADTTPTVDEDGLPISGPARRADDKDGVHTHRTGSSGDPKKPPQEKLPRSKR